MIIFWGAVWLGRVIPFRESMGRVGILLWDSRGRGGSSSLGMVGVDKGSGKWLQIEIVALEKNMSLIGH